MPASVSNYRLCANIPCSYFRFEGFPLAYATAYQIADARFSTLPRFPYTHTDTTAQPLVYLLEFASHIGQTVIFRPPSQVFPNGCFTKIDEEALEFWGMKTQIEDAHAEIENAIDKVYSQLAKYMPPLLTSNAFKEKLRKELKIKNPERVE